MIKVQEAKEIIEKNTKALKPLVLPLSEAYGHALAEDIFTSVNTPPFNQSAMDGFAFKYSNSKTYKVVGEVPAGFSYDKELKGGEAVRIFTGAMMPSGADTVVMQEKVVIAEESIEITELPEQYANVRTVGSQLKKGERLLSKGDVINGGAAGIAATCGIGELKVVAKPMVTIVITGSELVAPGKDLQPGKIYESNSVTLLNALRSVGINDPKVVVIKDNKEEVVKQLIYSLQTSDLILFSGGISVGKYDYVNEALQETNVQTLFYKIKQKPGKPLYYGKKDEVQVFGLPGNPAAALTCFYEYVYIAIKKLMGHTLCKLPRLRFKLTEEFSKKNDLTLFLKAKVEGDTVTLLEGQESYIIKSFSEANALAVIPEDSKKINKGDWIEVSFLPFS